MSDNSQIVDVKEELLRQRARIELLEDHLANTQRRVNDIHQLIRKISKIYDMAAAHDLEGLTKFNE